MKELNQINNRNDLADFLNVPRAHLSYILYIKKIENLYNTFHLPKKNGGTRPISAPLDPLKSIQKKLASAIYLHISDKYKGKTNNISHGYVKGKDIISNATLHRNKNYVLNIDLDNFFSSIHFGRVSGFFQKNHNFLLSKEAAIVIAQLTCYEGKLPQGASTSPIISNLICEIFDQKISKIAKKYRVKYSRYVDDLTFSTNDPHFLSNQEIFYKEISKVVIKSGFKINEDKVRLQFKDSRQMVTGLIVNKKINVPQNYYKLTRAMAHHLYKIGEFSINNEKGTLHQLEGRLAFINQINKHNNILEERTLNKLGKNKLKFKNLNSRESTYQEFLYYKHFFANEKPLIVTEGKTDIVYLKSALKNMYLEYPELISKNPSDNSFEFKVSFLKKTKNLEYFLGIVSDGADTFKNIYDFFASTPPTPNFYEKLRNLNENGPQNPVILLYDNEMSNHSKKPLRNFINHAKIKGDALKALKTENKVQLIGNLFLLTVPLVNGKHESDIEDLFDEVTLSNQIGGKDFSKKSNFETDLHYGKEIFSTYIKDNYAEISFDNFKPLLDNIKLINDIKFN